jgi:hypothetical protein
MQLPRGSRRWCVSTQEGKGAQGLIFPREALVRLLGEKHFARRCLDVSLNPRGKERGTVNIDGGVVDAAQRLGIRELVHVPGLLWHDVAEPSAIGHDRVITGDGERRAPQPEVSWVGADFDCTTILDRL